MSSYTASPLSAENPAPVQSSRTSASRSASAAARQQSSSVFANVTRSSWVGWEGRSPM
eukprot:CAMPEP_0117605344 /NCGR_PEP_ID=MMETSP0784-20121206/79146_1 /TAXON_ID=39447 /ORGANISM="" /LENGTH=57 /DNA_ID=CAMNT_0005408387 /DNA_START=386 /DNA_END=556 /DNA_ORIENTATION=+